MTSLGTFTTTDVLWRDLFNSTSNYSFVDSESPHPVNIYTNKDSTLFIEVACVGADKDEISIEKVGNILNIEYEKPKNQTDETCIYYTRKISKKSFKLSYKIDSSYDLGKLNISLNNGLLVLEIPKNEESKPFKFKIK